MATMDRLLSKNLNYAPSERLQIILMVLFQLWERLLKVGVLHEANKAVHDRWSAGNFWIYPLLKCFNYPLRDIFKLRTKCLTNTRITFQSKYQSQNKSYPRKTLLYFRVQQNICQVGLLIVRLQLALRGCHPPPPTYTHTHTHTHTHTQSHLAADINQSYISV